MNTQSNINQPLNIRGCQVKKLLNKLHIDEPLFEEMLCRENRMINIIQDCLVTKELNGSLDYEQRKQWQESRLGDRVEELFLQKQTRLSKIDYWQCLIKAKSEAMNTYYQLCNEEISFVDLKDKNQSTKFLKNQIFSNLDINLRKIFQSGKPGQIFQPLKGKYGYLIFQIIRFSRLKLTPSLRQDLLKELELNWALNQVKLALEEI